MPEQDLELEDIFAEDVAENAPAPNDKAYEDLDKLIKKHTEARAKVERLEAELKAAKAEFAQLDEHDLPNHMHEVMRVAKVTTLAGLVVEVKTKIYASIGKRQAEAFQWLEENGHGAIIKRNIVTAFNQGEEEKARALMAELAQRFPAGVKEERKVAPATITSLVTRELERGVAVPEKTFGIHERRFMSIGV